MKIEKIGKETECLIRDTILAILRDSNIPLSLDEIRQSTFTFSNVSLNQEKIKKCMDRLIDRGYDIREVMVGNNKKYYLARTGELELPVWRSMNRVRLPILFTGDWHIGSSSFYERGIDDMLEAIDAYKIKTVLHLGDLLQGLGVYKKELKDLVIHDIDGQIEKASEILNRFSRRVSIHLVMGGHEEVLKGRHEVGLDALSVLARMVRNLNYYGDRMLLQFNKKYTIYGIHSSGSSTLASSYRVERIFRELVEKPTILAIGHTHKLYSISKPPHHLLLEVGTLQRESSYIINKGLTSMLGYYILLTFKPEETILIRRLIKTK